MSVALESKTRIEGLIAAANAATGNADTDLTAAVSALIGGFGQGGMPEGMNVFLLTLTESYATSADGWTLTIPHGLGKAPGFAIVLRKGGISNASHFRGWFGNAYDIPENWRLTGPKGFAREEVSIQDSAASWLYADEANLYCKSGGWGGTLTAGTTLIVGVFE